MIAAPARCYSLAAMASVELEFESDVWSLPRIFPGASESAMKRRIKKFASVLFVLAGGSCGESVETTGAVFNVTSVGATVSLAGGRVQLTVPPGAVSSDLLITAAAATTAPVNDLLASGSALSFSPTGLIFARPVTITVDISALALPAGVRGRELRLHRIKGAGWELIPGSSVNAAGTMVTASLATLETLGLVGLPVTSVQIDTPRDSIAVGASVQLQGIAKYGVSDTLTDRPITWTSSAPGIAVVSSTGSVTGVAPGRVGITATSGASFATDTITVLAPVVLVFADGFESADYSLRQNGVSWVSTPWMDISSNVARTGTRSARFRQGESGSWGELRFGGLPNMPEVFLQFYLYMPRGTESPSLGPRVRVLGSRNDKFFRLWGSNDAMYGATPGNKVGASIWGDGTDGSVGQEYQYTPDNAVQWGMGEGPVGAPRAPLVIDANRGRWVRIRIRCKVSGPDNRSGIIQMWADNTILLNSTRLQTYPPGGSPNSYTHGYILGHANNGFQPGQYMYVDDVTISSSGFPP